MKRCPTCQRTYTDETVKFCRVDGVTLVNDSAGLSESEATRVLPESRAAVRGLVEHLSREPTPTPDYCLAPTNHGKKFVHPCNARV